MNKIKITFKCKKCGNENIEMIEKEGMLCAYCRNCDITKEITDFYIPIESDDAN